MNISTRLSALSILVSTIACDVEEQRQFEDDAELRTGAPTTVSGPAPDDPEYTLCQFGRIDFDGHCINELNIEDYIDFDEEDSTFLEVMPCDDDPRPAHCMDILVDRGEGQALRVYRIVDDDSTCGTVLNTCFGGWVSPFHVAYTSEAIGGTGSYFLHTEARVQWDERVRVGNQVRLVTRHGATHETTSSYQQQEGSSAVDIDQSYRIRDAQGIVVEELVEEYTMIASSDVEDDVKERCENTAESIGNIFDGVGQAAKVVCNGLPTEVTVGEGISATWELNPCDDLTEGRQKIVEGVLGLWAEHCKANPQDWFPGMFDENDALPGANPESLDLSWVDQLFASMCHGESFTNTEARSSLEGGISCEWIVDVTYTCDTNCHCEEVGESAPREQVCTES